MGVFKNNPLAFNVQAIKQLNVLPLVFIYELNLLSKLYFDSSIKYQSIKIVYLQNENFYQYLPKNF